MSSGIYNGLNDGMLNGQNDGLLTGTANGLYSNINNSLEKETIKLISVGVFSSNEIIAVNTLIKSLKSNSLWSSLNAIYPFVGGTAITHKWNLKNPQDTTAAFRLAFSGSWTHSSTGALPNGVNAYADTYYSTTTNAAQDASSMGIYLRTNTDGAKVDMGAWISNSNSSQILAKFSNTLYGAINSVGLGNTTSNTSSTGFYIVSRTGTNAGTVAKNTTQINLTETSVAHTNTIYLGARNNSGTAFAYSDREIAFAFMGTGLTAAQCTTLYTIVQTYQTTLGRQV